MTSLPLKDFQKSVRAAFLVNRDYDKIFCVGRNKTGTSSIQAFFKLYGLKTPPQADQELTLTSAALRGDFAPMAQYCSAFEAFQDLPFSMGDFYVAADALFPNSKFILTLRDPEDWYTSMLNFQKKVYQLGVNEAPITEQAFKANAFYLAEGYAVRLKERLLLQRGDAGTSVKPNWDLLYDKDFYIEEYEQRNKRIMAHFYESDERLLCINVSEERDTAKLCDFLSIPSRFKTRMPHENANN